MQASIITPLMLARTKNDWSNSSLMLRPGGALAWMLGSAFLILSMMSSVLAAPLFRMGMMAVRRPFLAHDVGLHGRSLVHEGHVADVHRRAVHRPDGQVVERGNGLGAGVQLDVVFAVADFG